jgi:hypothetical protein
MIDIRCLVLLVCVACTQGDGFVLIHPTESVRMPPALRQACAVTEQRCSRCHDLERIRLAHHELVDWPVYVDRMRRQPASGITADDAPVILKCLDYMKTKQREQDR